MLSSINKLGLVFSGGGAKGAYQIGVWRALKEIGIDKQIEAVSGTSVGAINGAMFCQGNIEQAEQLWREITKLKILTPNAGIILKHIKAAISTKGGFIAKLTSVGKSIYANGIFSREGLINIFDNHLNTELIKKSQIPLYVCTFNASCTELNAIKLNTRSAKSMRDFLLASSAIPAIFRHERIGGSHHFDGGLVPFKNNNIPFEVLIEKEKCREIINVFLTTKPALKKQESYPKIKFINIFPSKKFEGSIPSLNFSPEVAGKWIQRGYEDALCILLSK